MTSTSLLSRARSALAGGSPANRYLVLLSAIAFGGIGLSVVSFVDVLRSDRAAAQEAFEAASELRVFRIQQELDATLEAVETLATFFESSNKVTEVEFRRFAEGLFNRLPTVRALQWIEPVPAAARSRYEQQRLPDGNRLRIWEPGEGGRIGALPRATYFPVRYIAPEIDSTDLVGIDIGFESRRRDALVHAARSGQPIVSRPITLVLERQLHPAVLVVRPVYDNAATARLRGYASSSVTVADVVKRAQIRLTGLKVVLDIYERTEAGRGDLLYASGAPGTARQSTGPNYAAALHIGNQNWDIYFTPSTGSVTNQIGALAWAVLIGGLAATALLFFYVRALYRNALSTHHANAALRLRDRAIEASTDAIVIVRADRLMPTIEYVNAAFERITGYAREEVIGRDWRILQSGGESRQMESGLEAMMRSSDEGSMLLRSYRKDGTPFWNSLHIAPVCDDNGRRTHVVAIIDDVTDVKSYEEQLEHQATHDVLTGLPNRALLLDRIGQGIAHARRNEHLMALIFVDLDHFKRINDGYGHGAGDEVLRGVAGRIASTLRANDTVARYAGDEFVIVLNEQTDEGSVAQYCKRLSFALSEPLRMNDQEMLLSASIGVSLFPRDGGDAEALLKNADTAMYRVKDEGRGNTRFFTQDIGTNMHLRLSLEQSLRRALERGEFLLEYQPRVDLNSGAVCGVEALVRWERPGHGRVAPAQFIGLAEDNGLIVPIGEWVMETACRQAAAWVETHGAMLMSVNLSPRQFRQRDLVELIERLLTKTGLDPRQLELEVTESTMMHDVQQATKTLRALSSLGVRLALDDFGTGYSSLAYLKTFPINDLKIDRSFVRDVVCNKEDAQIARAIIGLASTLGLRVVAEGVENSEQLKFLCNHGCDEGQGYLFARPMPADQLAGWTAQWNPQTLPFGSGTRARIIPMRR